MPESGKLTIDDAIRRDKTEHQGLFRVRDGRAEFDEVARRRDQLPHHGLLRWQRHQHQLPLAEDRERQAAEGDAHRKAAEDLHLLLLATMLVPTGVRPEELGVPSSADVQCLARLLMLPGYAAASTGLSSYSARSVKPIAVTPPLDLASVSPPCMRAMAATIDSPRP